MTTTYRVNVYGQPRGINVTIIVTLVDNPYNNPLYALGDYLRSLGFVHYDIVSTKSNT